jgi:hypothetical protein
MVDGFGFGIDAFFTSEADFRRPIGDLLRLVGVRGSSDLLFLLNRKLNKNQPLALRI